MATASWSDHETRTKQRFDDWSDSATFRRLQPWLAFVQDRVLEQIDWSRTSAFLDVACGSGRAVFLAAERMRGRTDALACGCDISDGMLHQRNRDREGTQFLCASAQSLPYEGGMFDAVICTVAFHHFPDPAQALAEMRRVLRPGGTVVIADPCRDQSPLVWVWDRLHRWFERGHVQYYRRDQFRALLRQAGFRDVEVKDLRPSYAVSRKIVRDAALVSGRSPR